MAYIPPPLGSGPRAAIALCSIVVVLSAVVGIVSAIIAPAKPAWMLAGFELVVAVAGVLGLLTSRGAFPAGPAMAVACVAGTVFVSAVLGYKSLNPPALGAVPLKPFLLGRLAISAALFALAAWVVLSRNPLAFRTFIRGALWGAPLIAIGAAALTPPGRAMLARLSSLGSIAQIVLVVIGFLIATILVSISGHLIIRAFELGRGSPGDATPG